MNDIPKRLARWFGDEGARIGGDARVAFLAGLILTIFFVVYGPRIFLAGLEQIRDPRRRSRVE